MDSLAKHLQMARLGYRKETHTLPVSRPRGSDYSKSTANNMLEVRVHTRIHNDYARILLRKIFEREVGIGN